MGGVGGQAINDGSGDAFGGNGGVGGTGATVARAGGEGGTATNRGTGKAVEGAGAFGTSGGAAGAQPRLVGASTLSMTNLCVVICSAVTWLGA